MYILGRKLSFDWKSWLGWIIATLAAIELCVLCMYHLVTHVLLNQSPLILFLAIAGAAGTALGTAQWFWLRKRSTMGPWWIVATVSGWFLAVGGGLLLSLVLQHIPASGGQGKTFLDSSLADLLMYSITSVLIALPQFFLLRRHVSKSAWWIATRPLSWLAGWALAYLAYEWKVMESSWIEPDRILGFGVPEILGWCVFFFFFGTGFAAVTGASMVLLVPNQGPPRQVQDRNPSGEILP